MFACSHPDPLVVQPLFHFGQDAPNTAGQTAAQGWAYLPQQAAELTCRWAAILFGTEFGRQWNGTGAREMG